MAVVHVINKLSAKDLYLASLLRRLVAVTLEHNIYVRSVHVPGARNIIPDLLSRNQVHQARREQPTLVDQPVKVPDYLLPDRLLIQ